MISCDQFMASFGDLLEGDVAQTLRHQLEEHLSHCKTCQIIYDSSRKTLRIVTDSGSFDLPHAAAQRIRDKIVGQIRQDKAV